MAAWWVVPLVASIVALVIALAAWRPVRAAMRENELARARRDFHRQREHLEARFMRLAGQSGKPRGLEWVRCDFDDDVIYARHRQSGELSAFVSVTIGFEAIEGGGMEEVEAVGNLRAATAVFRVETRHLGHRRPGAVQSESQPRRSPTTRTTWNWSARNWPSIAR